MSLQGTSSIKVYLAGPVTGRTYHEANAWRTQIPFDVINPLRFNREDMSDKEAAFCGMKNIVRRNFHDVSRCDVVLAYLRTSVVSFGSLYELAWAYALRKPTVVVCDWIHDHPYLQEAADFRCNDLAEAIRVIHELF